MVENAPGVAYQATAADPERATIVYALAGGADAARFTIDAGGAVRFASAPNYERPTDADGDNVYQLAITASDGVNTTPLSVAITVTNDREGVQVRRIASGFGNPVALATIRGNASQMLVGERDGTIYRLDLQTGQKTLIYRLRDAVGSGVPELKALLADRSFAANGSFYALYTIDGRTVVVNNFRLNLATWVPNAFGPVILRTGSDYKGGGWLGYGADDVMLAAIGDADIGGTLDPSSPFGKLLRIAPNPDPYAGASPNFWIVSTAASGLRSPHGGVQTANGLLLADRGQSVMEEVDLISLTSAGNFGWPFREGSRVVREGGPAGLIDPVLAYSHGTGVRNGAAIVGGAIGATGSLTNIYVFADEKGAIFTIPLSALQLGTTVGPDAFERRDLDFAPDQGSVSSPRAIVAGTDNTLYLVDAGGDVFAVTAS